MNDSWDVKSIRHSGQYESCMKINGIPLLPPVLSKQCRQEMQYYKLLAKEVEKRIQLLQQEECQGKEKVLLEIPVEVNETTADIKVTLKELELDVYNSPQKEHLKQDNSLQGEIKKENNNNVDNVCGGQEHQQSLSDIPEKDDSSKNKTQSTGKLYKNSHHSKTFDFSDLFHHKDSPTLASKTFTGSLGDLHKEACNDAPKLTRQNSYLVLEPSPHLIAHLTEQTLNLGIEMTSISMSESLSDITQMSKKRRNWDLENAKDKWSKMAQSLGGPTAGPAPAKGLASKTFVMSERHHPSPRKSNGSPHKTQRQNFMEPLGASSPRPPGSPGAAGGAAGGAGGAEGSPRAEQVRGLYERVRRQQAAQMAALVARQQREQRRLRGAFEEQNALLAKQLRSVCPLSPPGARRAWAGKEEPGPVSLRDLTPPPDARDYLRRCDDALRRSRDATGPRCARRIAYESGGEGGSEGGGGGGAGSEADEGGGGAATDRTADTLADLNVTLPTDSEPPPPTERERRAATVLAAAARGYLTRRLLRTAAVQRTVRTIAEALRAALELHADRAVTARDVQLHRRLIQQITAACYSLHETFVTSSPAERCAAIAADRARLRAQRHTAAAAARGAGPARARPASSASQRTVCEYLSDPSRSPGLRRPWR